MDVPSPVQRHDRYDRGQEGPGGVGRHLDRDRDRRAPPMPPPPPHRPRASAGAPPPEAPAAAAARCGRHRRAAVGHGGADCRTAGRARSGRARRRPGRLHGGLSRGGSGPEGHAHRALAGSGRRVPERRLHSLEGAAACGQGDRGCRRHGAPAASCSLRRRSTASKLARLEEPSRDQIDQRPHAAREAAQGRRGARRGEVRRPAFAGAADAGRREAPRLQAVHHRGRIRVGAPAGLSGRSAHHRFDRRARTAARLPAAAGDRRRHHRSRDGLRLRCARHDA